MNIIWQNPLLLYMLSLAAVPLLLHLLARRNPPVFLFSSNEFLRKAVRMNARIRRPVDILLLILRTLAFTALILVFTRPLLSMQGAWLGGEHQRQVVLIIDASASMGAQENSRSRFAAACAEASEIISGLGRNDHANIIWLKRTPEPEFPAMGVNLRALQNALRQRHSTNEAGNVKAAFDVASSMLAEAKGRKEIYLISDFQASQWQNVKLPESADVSVMAVRIGHMLIGNQAPKRIFTRPELVLAGQPVEIGCEIFNYSPQLRKINVFFSADGIRKSAALQLPAWSSATQSFSCTFKKEGVYPVTVSIDEDAFPADNSASSLVKVLPGLEVAIIADQQYPAVFWEKALRFLPWINARMVPFSDLQDGKKFNVVMLSGWKGQGMEQLKNYLNNGASVICAPSPEVTLEAIYKLDGVAAGQEAAKQTLKEQMSKQGFKLRSPELNHRIFGIFKQGDYGSPLDGTCQARLDMSELKLPGAQTIISYADDCPALMEAACQGQNFWLWNLDLRPENSQLALRKQFLPFLAELLLKTCRDPGLPDHFFRPGMNIVKTFSSGITENEIELADQSGKLIGLTGKTAAGQLAVSSVPVADCGVYTWLHHKQPVDYAVVNFPPEESDLRPFEGKLPGCKTVFVSGKDASDTARGIDLWPMLLVAAIIFLLAEGGVTLMAGRKQ